MRLTHRCPDCGTIHEQTIDADSRRVTCSRCHLTVELTPHALVDGKLARCLVCPGRELFTRKDFPQRLGVAIVVLGFGLSSVAWFYHQVILTFVILALTALVDVALYFTVRDVVECYHCHALYRDTSPGHEVSGFELETHERIRQQQIRAASLRKEAEKPSTP